MSDTLIKTSFEDLSDLIPNFPLTFDEYRIINQHSLVCLYDAIFTEISNSYNIITLSEDLIEFKESPSIYNYNTLLPPHHSTIDSSQIIIKIYAHVCKLLAILSKVDSVELSIFTVDININKHLPILSNFIDFLNFMKSSVLSRKRELETDIHRDQELLTQSQNRLSNLQEELVNIRVNIEQKLKTNMDREKHLEEITLNINKLTDDIKVEDENRENIKTKIYELEKLITIKKEELEDARNTVIATNANLLPTNEGVNIYDHIHQTRSHVKSQILSVQNEIELLGEERNKLIHKENNCMSVIEFLGSALNNFNTLSDEMIEYHENYLKYLKFKNSLDESKMNKINSIKQRDNETENLCRLEEELEKLNKNIHSIKSNANNLNNSYAELQTDLKEIVDDYIELSEKYKGVENLEMNELNRLEESNREMSSKGEKITREIQEYIGNISEQLV